MGDENRGGAVDAIGLWSVLVVMERAERPTWHGIRRVDGDTPVTGTAIDVDTFVRSVTPRLVGALTIRVGDRSVAEDLAHEALARAVADWDRVSAMASPDGWVFRVAFNLAASRWRRLRVRRRVEAMMDRTEPSMFLLTAESLAVRESLSRLSERQVQVIVLRYYAGFDVAEVASILRVSTSTVTTLTARALRTMRADLEDDG